MPRKPGRAWPSLRLAGPLLGLPWLLCCAGLCLWLMALSGAHAQGAAKADAALEERLVHLTEQLRCLVCQNQTIADSTADLAVDLKNEVREKLARGESDQQIVDFMVTRYGEFVLYRPPVKGSTWALWFGPFLLLLGGLALLGLRLRRAHGPAVILSPEDQAKAAGLLADPHDLKETQA